MIQEIDQARNLIDLINTGNSGLSMARAGQEPRKHLFGDPEHAMELMVALNLAVLYQDMINLISNDEESLSSLYNKIIVFYMLLALSDPTTVVYQTNYHNMSGYNLGRQTCMEFTYNGKRILVSWKHDGEQKGQMLNAFVVSAPGTKIGNFVVPDPKLIFQNREFILGDEETWKKYRPQPVNQ